MYRLYSGGKMKNTLFLPVICTSGLLLLTCQEQGEADHSSAKPDREHAEASSMACERCVVLADQSDNTIVIADVGEGNIEWEWSPRGSEIQAADVTWFKNLSDAKPVYGLKYILTCASGGGVALIRMEDKKVVFYAYAGGNTHSVELLPDGNIVSASSTGNYLTVFSVDTLHSAGNITGKRFPIKFGHNVVWDDRDQLLWTAAGSTLYAMKYNFNCTAPDLDLYDSIALPGKDAHDLFPAYGRDSLWFSNTTGIYAIDMENKKVSALNSTIRQNIKSISSGPAGYPVIILKPKEKWWSDEVVDLEGNSIYQQAGMKAYKARWFVPNRYSYPEKDAFHVCEK